MTEYQIRIGAKNDPNPLFPEYADPRPFPLQVLGVAILEGQMASGKPGLYLIMTDDAGNRYTLGMSCEAFLTIGGGVKGAMERFGFPWTGA